jgi:hypothetical protein
LADAVALIELPRSMVARSDMSTGIADASSRRLAQPRSTPESTRARTAGSRAPEYATASRERSVSPSASATIRSRTGPFALTVAATIFVVFAVTVFACACAIVAYRATSTARTLSPFRPPTRA